MDSDILLSVCTISKNEEIDLPGFLDNVLNIADEVIIIDDNSTDNTEQIALNYGEDVKFVKHPMGTAKHFANQRNLAVKYAKGKWILHMDVDERLTPELATSVLDSIANTELNGFRYHRLNHFINHPIRGGGWQYWNSPQLAKKGHHRFKNALHEICEIEGGTEKTGQLKGEMWHLIDANFKERLEKNILYAELTAEQLVKAKDIKWFHLFFVPLYRALKSFFWQKGFTQGTRGLIFALFTFSGTFNWYAFAWFKQHKKDRNSIEASLMQKWQETKSNRR